MEKIVGMVGLGFMGSALSANLLKAGYRVLGCDPDGERVREFRERGGTPVASPAEAAGGAPVVVLSLPHSGIVREACLGENGLAGGAGKETLVIDTTTARPEDSAEIAAELENRGIAFLDASLSGTSKMAWSRDLVAMVGEGPRTSSARNPSWTPSRERAITSARAGRARAPNSS